MSDEKNTPLPQEAKDAQNQDPVTKGTFSAENLSAAEAEPKTEENTSADGSAIGEPKKRSGLQSKLDRTDAYDQGQLNDELEKLAATFREELKKASENPEDSAEAGELIQQLDIETPAPEPEIVIAPEDLCECCGKRHRDTTVSPDYKYCTVCREAMRHYPIGIQYYFMLVAVLAAAVFAVFAFIKGYSAYNDTRLARTYVSENKKTSAIAAYDNAISACKSDVTDKISGRKLNLESAMLIYSTMPDGLNSMKEVSDRIDDTLTVREAKLPIFDRYLQARQKSLLMYNTLQAFYTMMNDDYPKFTGDNNKTYKEIISKLDDMKDDQVQIQKFGSTTEYEKVTYDAAMLNFAKYMIAFTAKDYDNATTYLQAVRQAEPSYVWLYGYELGNIDVQKKNYDDAGTLIGLLKANNAEDETPYVLEASISRLKGDSKKAIEYCEQGIKIDTDSSNPELYRQEAMAYCVLGEYDNAKTAAQKGLNIDNYGNLYFVYMVAAKEKGDTKLVSEIKGDLKNMGATYPDRFTSYLNGKLTAKQLFTEGSGDVE